VILVWMLFSREVETIRYFFKSFLLLTLLPFIVALSEGEQFQLNGKTYTIVGEIGRGGIGQVYKIKSPNGEVAAAKFVKDTPRLPLEEYTERQLQNFQDFHRAHETSQGLHPVLDVGLVTVEGPPTKKLVIVSPLRTDDLREQLNRKVSIRLDSRDSAIQLKIKIDQIINIVDDILNGVRKIHEAGYIHSDIKPANILINSKNRAEISDWDFLTRLTIKSAADSVVNPPRGTPLYIAPERIMSMVESSYHQDYYGIGGIVYNMLATHTLITADYALNHEKGNPQSLLNSDILSFLYTDYDSYFKHLKLHLDSQKYRNKLDTTYLKKFLFLRELALTFLQYGEQRLKSLAEGGFEAVFEIKDKSVESRRHFVPMIRQNINLQQIATTLNLESAFPAPPQSRLSRICGQLKWTVMALNKVAGRK